MRTAGHAVLASGVTVAISLLALIVVPVPFLRSMGLGGMLIPLVSVAVVLTLLPALLSSIGPRVDWPRIRHGRRCLAGLVGLGAADRPAPLDRHRRGAGRARRCSSLPVFGLKIGQSGIDSLATQRPGVRRAADAARTAASATGVLTPIAVLVPERRGRRRGRAAARTVDGVRTAVRGGTPAGRRVVDVLPDAETVDSTGTDVVDGGPRRRRGRRRTATSASPAPGPTVQDYFRAVYDNFPYVLRLIALITFVLLVRTFRSMLLPIKAVVLNLVSLAAVFGCGRLLLAGGPRLRARSSACRRPARSRSGCPWSSSRSCSGCRWTTRCSSWPACARSTTRPGRPPQAVVTGLGRTGRLVTSAALILFFAFAALASSPGTDIKVLGTALGVGILIDATIVRALLVPALVSLFGRWNWWLPDRAGPGAAGRAVAARAGGRSSDRPAPGDARSGGEGALADLTATAARAAERCAVRPGQLRPPWHRSRRRTPRPAPRPSRGACRMSGCDRVRRTRSTTCARQAASPGRRPQRDDVGLGRRRTGSPSRSGRSGRRSPRRSARCPTASNGFIAATSRNPGSARTRPSRGTSARPRDITVIRTLSVSSGTRLISST